MKNNLSKILLIVIQIIIAIVLVLSTLIVPSNVMASPSEEELLDSTEEIPIEIDSEENIKISSVPQTVTTNSASSEKYLFVGNSKTYYNNFPFMFQNFMNALGKNVIVREATRGGHSLKDLWEKQSVREEFNNYFDYVIIQPKQLKSSSGETDAAVNMVNQLKAQNPNIKVIINGIWKSKDEYKTNTKAQNIMNKRFRALREELIKRCAINDVRISYWGQAVLRAVYSNSIKKSSLFVDERHPTALNSYLGVASLYSTITGLQSNCEYNGTVNNNQFSSKGKYDLNNWNYLADIDRWKIDTDGVDNTSLMKYIAYKTYLTQKSDETDKIDATFKIDNSPRIRINKKDNNQGIEVVVTDYNGLKDENIKIYKSDKKTEIKPKQFETKTQGTTTYQLIYSFGKNYFNNNYKEIYVDAKDNNGNYNKSTFSIKKDSNNKYSVDAAPRLRRYELNYKEKKTTLNVVDRGGIKYLKIYDLNQKDDNGNYVLVKQIENLEGGKEGKNVEIDLKELKEKDDKENEDTKNHYYNIKVVAKDINGRKCKRIINYKITVNQ